MRRGPACIGAVLACLLAGCGGSSDSSSTAKQAAGVVCKHLTADDVARITAMQPATTEGLAAQRGRNCGTLFVTASGQLLVALTEYAGGVSELRQIRSTQRAQAAGHRLQNAPRFGSGAFVANGQFLAFQHGNTIVTVESGFKPHTNEPLVSEATLEQLAGAVARRL